MTEPTSKRAQDACKHRNRKTSHLEWSHETPGDSDELDVAISCIDCGAELTAHWERTEVSGPGWS